MKKKVKERITFNFIVVCIVDYGKEGNGNNSHLEKKNKINERNVV